MKREDVEALRERIKNAHELDWGMVTLSTRQLSALLDIAEAVMGAEVGICGGDGWEEGETK